MRKNTVDTGIKVLAPENNHEVRPTLKGLSLNSVPSEPVNSWRYARLFRIPLERQRASKQTDLESALTLNQPYAQIPDGYEHTKDCEDYIDDIESVLSSPVEAFVDYVNAGTTPPSYITIALAKGFEHYLESGGKIDLEEVFFGKTVRGQGNFAQRAQLDLNYEDFQIEAIGYVFTDFDGKTTSSNPDSLTTTAECFLTRNDINIDVDSFLRGFRRWQQRELKKLEAKTGRSLSSITIGEIDSLQHADGTPLTSVDRSRLSEIISCRKTR